jgi:hypothetical protein
MIDRPDFSKARVVNLAEVLEQRRANAQKAKTATRSRPSRRPRSEETFARFPYGRARDLFRQIGGPAWMLLIEIDRLVLENKGRNPVKLTTEALEGSDLTRRQVQRGLRRLERAEVITVEHRSGRCPLVAHLWYPIKIKGVQNGR